VADAEQLCATSARVRRRSSRIKEHPTAEVRPNSSENSQINPSTIVRSDQDEVSRLTLAFMLHEGEKSLNIQGMSGSYLGEIPQTPRDRLRLIETTQHWPALPPASR
jgi:hypothetical protein